MSGLQVVTRNLPWFIRDPAESIIGRKCYHSLVHNVDLSDKDCLKLAFSKALGVGLVAGGAIVKVPQIAKIVRARSARGISLSSYLLDTASTAIYVAYVVRNEFPWSTYGETVFLLIQNVVIIALVIYYSRGPTLPTLAAVATVGGAAGYALSTPSIITPSALKMLVSASIPLSVSSKLPQIIRCFQLGSTGQLSAFLVFNSLFGCLARVYTTSTETGDKPVFWNYVLNSLLNGVLAAQMIATWNKDADRSDKPRLTSAVRAHEPARYQAKDEISGQARPASQARDDKAGNVAAALMDKQSQPGTPTGVSKTSRTSSPASAKRYVRKLE